MKILELTRSFYPSIGGMEKFVDDRLKIYKSLEHNYQVVTTTHSEKKLQNTQKLNFIKYLPSFTPYEIVPRLKQAMDIDYDILSVNQVGYYYTDYAIKRAFRDKKKIILTPHFYFHTDRYKIFKDLHYKFILPNTLKKIDKMICFTKYEANFWIKNFPFLEKKIEIIPHYFKPSKDKLVNKKNEFDNFFLYLGRGEKNKRIDLLIPAFDQIKSNFQLILTIYEDELSELNKFIVSKNNKIHLLGRISESRKQNLLSTCSALVLPTDYEAFGIVNLEASYYKKPLLLSELEIFTNILDSNGVVYFNNNLESLKTAIIKFISMGENEKNNLGIKNYFNLKHYSFGEITKQYNHLLEKLF